MLTLAVVHSTEIPVVCHALNTVQEIVSFITVSPKSLECLLSNSSSKTHHQRFSDTHWSQHGMRLSTVFVSHDDVLTTLVEQKTDGDGKRWT